MDLPFTLHAPDAGAKVEVWIDAKIMVGSLDGDQQKELLLLLADEIAGSEFVEAFELEGASGDLTDRGSVILDCFVERSKKLDRLPEDFEPGWVAEFRCDLDHLQDLIVEGCVDDALDLIRQAVPDNDFLSNAARKMLAAQRAGQKALSL